MVFLWEVPHVRPCAPIYYAPTLAKEFRAEAALLVRTETDFLDEAGESGYKGAVAPLSSTTPPRFISCDGRGRLSKPSPGPEPPSNSFSIKLLLRSRLSLFSSATRLERSAICSCSASTICAFRGKFFELVLV